MEAGRKYLVGRYGESSSGLHLTVAEPVYSSADRRDGYYIVNYWCTARTGALKATFSDYERHKGFTIEEETQAEQNPQPTNQ
jgi:hypothetical protein